MKEKFNTLSQVKVRLELEIVNITEQGCFLFDEFDNPTNDLEKVIHIYTHIGLSRDEIIDIATDILARLVEEKYSYLYLMR